MFVFPHKTPFIILHIFVSLFLIRHHCHSMSPLMQYTYCRFRANNLFQRQRNYTFFAFLWKRSHLLSTRMNSLSVRENSVYSQPLECHLVGGGTIKGCHSNVRICHTDPAIYHVRYLHVYIDCCQWTSVVYIHVGIHLQWCLKIDMSRTVIIYLGSLIFLRCGHCKNSIFMFCVHVSRSSNRVLYVSCLKMDIVDKWPLAVHVSCWSIDHIGSSSLCSRAVVISADHYVLWTFLGNASHLLGMFL